MVFHVQLECKNDIQSSDFIEYDMNNQNLLLYGVP